MTRGVSNKDRGDAPRSHHDRVASPARTPLANRRLTIDWGSAMAHQKVQESHDHLVEALRERLDEMVAAAAISAQDAADVDRTHVEAIHHLRSALESRDLIGQAKGLLMAKAGCSSDDAFDLLRAQSQHENRKLTDVAAELVERHNRTGVLLSTTRGCMRGSEER